MTKHTIGELAYLDVVHGGLVPCRVTGIDGQDITVVVTENRQLYRQGETVVERAERVVPRGHVRVRGGLYRVQTGYVWVPAPTI